MDKYAYDAVIDEPKPVSDRDGDGEILLNVDNLHLRYDSRGYFKKRRSSVRAVDGVTLSVRKGQIVAIVGESGSGKSSLGAVVVGLRKATSGYLTFAGWDITKPVNQRDPFQDHGATLNPLALDRPHNGTDP